jgi:hypothetical protein
MMRWKKITTTDPTATCNHITLGLPQEEPVLCGEPAMWRAETSCGCGAIHSELQRCGDHRISDLEDRIKQTERTIEGLVRYTRTLNPDIRTDEECILFAAGYRQSPRDDGDALWKSLNTTDAAEKN